MNAILFGETLSCHFSFICSIITNARARNLDDIFNIERISCAINTFDDYKSPGVLRNMLKCVSPIIAPNLKTVYQDCIIFNYVLKPYRQVMFIPKAGKVPHSTAKDY